MMRSDRFPGPKVLPFYFVTTIRSALQFIFGERYLKRLFTAWETFKKIESAEDIERFILRGQRFSRATCWNCRQAFTTFYRFTQEHYKLQKGLHPLQVTLAEIETFYDVRVKEVGVGIAYLDLLNLKRFFSAIESKIPGYTSPFIDMPDKLREKINSL